MTEIEEKRTIEEENRAVIDTPSEFSVTGGAPRTDTAKKRGKLPRAVVAVVVGCLVLNTLMMATIAVLVVVRRHEEKAATAAETSVDAHEGEVYIEDNALGGMWLPKSERLNESRLDNEKFTEKNGLLTYEGGALGIDVSEFQTVTDWSAVKDAGVEFVMVRVGRRGYELGKIVADTECRRNIEGALEAGLDVGVYFFSQAVTPNEAREEARFVLDCIKEYKITYPVVFDWESTERTEARTFEMTNAQLNAVARAFVDVVREGGYRPVLYFYKYLGYRQYVLDDFADCDFWLSEPGERPTFYYETAMWQYTTEGSVPGIDGTVDVNICFTPYG